MAEPPSAREVDAANGSRRKEFGEGESSAILFTE